MGYRFRKSVNFGIFRVNFSKSGIGYSVGGKGFRYTKTATGRTRATISAPGTGLSYVVEQGKRKKKNNLQKNNTILPNDNTRELLYSLDNNENMVSASREDFVDAINRYFKGKKRIKRVIPLFFLLFIVLMVISLLVPDEQSSRSFQMLIVRFILLDILAFVGSIIALPVYSLAKRVKVFYDFDEAGTEYVNSLYSAIDALQSCDAIWKVSRAFSSERRISGGASSSLDMEPIKIKEKTPKFLKTDETCYYIKCRAEEYFILPDMLVVLSKNSLSAIALDDLDILITDTEFVTGTPPKDATILYYTWKFVNNDGSPDRRYKNNVRLSVIQSGQIDFTTTKGLRVRLQLSSIEKALLFSNIVSELIEKTEAQKNAAKSETSEDLKTETEE